MAMNPLAVANLMAQAAQQKSQQPAPAKKKKSPKEAAEINKKAKGKPSLAPVKPPMPPQGGNGAPPMGGMPPQGM